MENALLNAELNAELSYSIFLLPFAYRLGDRLQDPLCTVWRPLDWGEMDKHPSRSAIWRLQYFMPETGLLLHKRAQWFELQGKAEEKDAWERAKELPGQTQQLQLAPPGLGSVGINLDWARLVLFECSPNGEDGAIGFAQNGTLAIKLSFAKGCTAPILHHLLWLNEAFRYYKIPYVAHVDPAKHGFKRHEVMRGLPGPTECENLGASYWAMWSFLLQIPIYDKTILGCRPLIPQDWHTNATLNAMANGTGQNLPTYEDLATSLYPSKNKVKPSPSSEKKVGTWDVYPDNRAFVWTCATLANVPGLRLPEFVSAGGRRWLLGPIVKVWHALLDVDREPMDVDAFRYQWLKERTYSRWARSGALYGFNNFSTALFGTPPDYISGHFETFYLDMGLILLQIRTSLFRLSRQLSDDTQTRLKYRTKAWDRTFRQLRSDFASFVNLYQFPLLSTQQQAIEMYAMMRKWFDVDDLFAEVKSEIEATHEIAELVADKRNESSLQAITIGGLGIAFGALVGQVFGMSNILGDLLKNDPQSFWTQTRWVVCSVILGSLVSLLWLWLGKKSRS
jgi:hypothetical protein